MDRLVVEEGCVVPLAFQVLLKGVRVQIARKIEKRRIAVDPDESNFHCPSPSHDCNSYVPSLYGERGPFLLGPAPESASDGNVVGLKDKRQSQLGRA